MKTRSIATKISLALLIIITSATGCKKDSTATVTADDAADAVTYSMQANTGGYAGQVADAATYAASQGIGKVDGIQTLSCGVLFDTSITKSYTGAFTATYNHEWKYLLNCSGIVPSSLAFTGTYNGSFSGARMESSNNGVRNLTFAGLGNGSNEYIVNGSFTRTGNHTSKVRNNYTFTTDIQTTITNVTVDKTTYKITGGAASVVAICNVSNGNSSTFNGNVTFNATHTATLVINGNTYTIDLY